MATTATTPGPSIPGTPSRAPSLSSIEMGNLSRMGVTEARSDGGEAATGSGLVAGSANGSVAERSAVTEANVLSVPHPNYSNLRSAAICLFSFLLTFTTCGTVFSFGIYQELYQAMSLQPNTPFTGATPAGIDIIGTLSAAFMLVGAPFATAWAKRFSPRFIIYIGAGILFAATMMASYSQHLWQFILTQGFLMGVGTCFSYIPAVTVAPTWFGKHRGVALGIILSGTGLGGLCWAPALHALNEHLGFRNGIRISGCISAGLVLVGGTVLDWDPATKARIREENARLRARSSSWFGTLWNVPLVDWRIARTAKFSAQLSANVMQAAAYYTPVFFFSAYARTLGYSAQQGANFISISNASNAIGKVIIGLLADKYGHINMLVICTIIADISTLALWLPSTQVFPQAGQALFVLYAIMYGAFAGAFVSLFPATLVELFGPQHFASVNGFLYMARGLATMLGTPVAGAMVKHSGALVPKSYLGMSILTGGLLFGASLGGLWIQRESKRA